MIPKIIHLCWLSGDPYPADIEACLKTWKEHLPDYEIWLWDTQRFDVHATKWTEQAFAARKYAFAADYIRLYALYHFGGIYLDSDVVVYKSFDDLLSLPYFIGHDQIGGFEAAIIGAQKGCKWVKDILDEYDGKDFLHARGEMDMLPLPCRFHHVLIEKGYHFRRVSRLEYYDEIPKLLNVFDGDFFNSRDAVEVRRTKKSYCAHNYMGSWAKPSKKFKIKKYIPKTILKMVYIIGQKTYNRNKYNWFKIPFENQ